MNILDFDTTKYKLGKLCKRGHDWNGTGKSLRDKGYACLDCRKLKRFEPIDWSKVEKRFWKKVHKTDSCWYWTAFCDPNGYGRLNINGNSVLAHRISYQLTYGAIPEGMDVLHKCDTPTCCSPFHLFLGTQADNNADRDSKGRFHPLKGNMNGIHKHPELVQGERNGFAKLTEKQVKEIRAKYVPKKVTLMQLGKEYGVSYSVISNIVLRKAWKHV